MKPTMPAMIAPATSTIGKMLPRLKEAQMLFFKVTKLLFALVVHVVSGLIALKVNDVTHSETGIATAIVTSATTRAMTRPVIPRLCFRNFFNRLNIVVSLCTVFLWYKI